MAMSANPTFNIFVDSDIKFIVFRIEEKMSQFWVYYLPVRKLFTKTFSASVWFVTSPKITSIKKRIPLKLSLATKPTWRCRNILFSACILCIVMTIGTFNIWFDVLTLLQFNFIFFDLLLHALSVLWCPCLWEHFRIRSRYLGRFDYLVILIIGCGGCWTELHVSCHDLIVLVGLDFQLRFWTHTAHLSKLFYLK
jgi:hypothetical protein